MNLPEKIQRYENLVAANFPVKRAVYMPFDYSVNNFVEEAERLLEEFPIIMLRTAFDETNIPEEKKLSLPRKFNLKNRIEIEEAYHKLGSEILQLGYMNPWTMAWHFYPNKELISVNLHFSMENRIKAEIFYNVGHEEGTQGNKTPLALEHNNNWWVFQNPEYREIRIERYNSLSPELVNHFPKGILFEALDSISPYLPQENYILDKLGNFNSVTLETITQRPFELLDKRKHFVLDYTVEKKKKIKR